jgi:hypothetical protein
MMLDDTPDRVSPRTAGNDAGAEEIVQEHFTASAVELSNADFLTSLFGRYLNPAQDPRWYAWLTCFAEDPLTAPKKAWYGQKWDGKPFVDPEMCTVNAFFSIGLLKAVAGKGAELATVQRRKANFGCLPCVMLDDIGTKADMLTLPPTWLIETSPGNYQAGYAFTAPIESTSDADIYIRALMTAGRLTDTGGQNITRYARLPVGYNTKAKYGAPFRHRLIVWEPERRYDPLELANALGLDLEVHKSPRHRKGVTASASSLGHDDEVFTPRPEENPVLAALKQRGIYKSPLGNGKHDITCPWVAEHTDEVDTGTAYFESDADFVWGGFKCLHGHCAQRRIQDLLSWLEVSDLDARHRPTFRTTGGTLHITVRNAERVLAETGRYFQQGGAIVTVTTPPGGKTEAKHIREKALPFLLTGIAAWLRFDARQSAWVHIDAPTKICAGLFEAPEYVYLPPLNAIARQPYLDPKGRLIQTSGYDPMTATFGAFEARLFDISELPTEAQVLAARDRLLALLDEVAFAEEPDRATALAAFLTAAVRPSLDVAPGFLFNAHASGSGKSYLQDMTILFATDGHPAGATLKANDDEMEKSILAALLRSPAVLKLDEAQGDILPIKFLVSALTSEFISGRILGQSKVVTPSTRTLVLFAGNNVQSVGDMTRRVVVCNLDVKVENPESREFRRDPKRQVEENRARYVSDALTLICAHNQTQERKPCRALNGFTRWDWWVRQTVLWLGLPDPCLSMFKVNAIDPNRERLGVLLGEWEACFGHDAKGAREVIRRAESRAELRAVLMEIAGKSGEIDATRLGYWLKNHHGKVLDGRRLERFTESKSSAARYVLRNLTNFQSNYRSPKSPSTPSGCEQAGDDENTRTYRTFRGYAGQPENVSNLQVQGDRI